MKVLIVSILLSVALFAQYTQRGAWSSVTTYATYDVVTFSGTTYVAVAGSTNITPGTDSPLGSKWAPVAITMILDEFPSTTWPRWNGAFAALGLNKATKYSGTTAPGSIAGNLTGDTYTDTAGHHQYVCGAPAGTAAPACTSVVAGGWQLTDGGGGSGSADAATLTPITLSSSPTFPNSKNTIEVFGMTLGSAATVSSSTLTVAGGKPLLGWDICQDAIGARAFVWPTTVLNAPAVDPTAHYCTFALGQWDGAKAVITLARIHKDDGTSIPGAIVLPQESGGGVTTVVGATGSSGKIKIPATSTTDLLVAENTPNILTNKGFDTATNSLRIAGTPITAVSGVGAVCLASGSACGGGSGGGYISLAPSSPSDSGSDGQYSADATYLYAYKTGWHRIAWDATWVSTMAATPTFSPVAGTYSGTQSVTMSTSSSGCNAKIYWNTTGSPTGADTNGTVTSVSASGTRYAKVIGCAGFTDSAVGSASYTIGAYVGPGDVSGGALAWFGLRAYSSATTTTKAARICNAADVACADVNSTGTGDFDVATATASPLSCGGAGGTCTVKTLYDQTSNLNCSGPCDVTQATIAARPVLTLSCLAGKVCMTFKTAATASQLLSASAVSGFIVEPFSMSGVAKQTTGGAFDGILATTVTPAFLGFNGSNISFLYEGSQLNVSAADNAFHAIQGVFGPTTSDITVDGVTTIGSAGNYGASGSLEIGPIDGQVVEAGMWRSDQRASVAALNSNQHAYWGF